MNRLFSTLVLWASSALAAQAEAVNPPEALTLDSAIQIALAHHPELRELQAQVEASEWRALQAGAFPNPEAIVRAENVPVRSKAKTRADYLAGFSQDLPIGGRLRAARQGEEIETSRLEKELAARMVDLRARVHGAFAAALYAQEALRFQTELLKNIQEMVRLVQARVEAGETTSEEAIHVELQLFERVVEMERAKALQARSMIALSAAMGEPRVAFQELSGSLEEALAVENIQEALHDMSLIIEASDADIAVRQAKLKQIRAERIPDINLELLYRRPDGTGENALDIGVRVQLPVLDGKQGRVRANLAEVAAAEARRDRVRMEVEAKRDDILARWKIASENLKRANETHSKAARLLKMGELRYREGDINLSDLLARKNEWVKVQTTRLESLRSLVEIWQSF